MEDDLNFKEVLLILVIILSQGSYAGTCTSEHRQGYHLRLKYNWAKQSACTPSQCTNVQRHE